MDSIADVSAVSTYTGVVETKLLSEAPYAVSLLYKLSVDSISNVNAVSTYIGNVETKLFSEAPSAGSLL